MAKEINKEDYVKRLELFQNTYLKAIQGQPLRGILKIKEDISEAKRQELIEAFSTVNTNLIVISKDCNFELISPHYESLPKNHPAEEVSAGIFDDEILIENKFEHIFPTMRYYGNDFLVVKKSLYELFYQKLFKE